MAKKSFEAQALELIEQEQEVRQEVTRAKPARDFPTLDAVIEYKAPLVAGAKIKLYGVTYGRGDEVPFKVYDQLRKEKPRSFDQLTSDRRLAVPALWFAERQSHASRKHERDVRAPARQAFEQAIGARDKKAQMVTAAEFAAKTQREELAILNGRVESAARELLEAEGEVEPA